MEDMSDSDTSSPSQPGFFGNFQPFQSNNKGALAPSDPNAPIQVIDNSRPSLQQAQKSGIMSSMESFKMQMGFQTPNAPSIRVVDTEMFPYPKFWVKRNHLRPSVVVAIDNMNQLNANNLIVMVVPMDPETRKPLTNARLEGAAQGIDEELSAESKKHGVLLVRFAEMKIMGDKTLSSKHGNDIQLAFCLYSKHTFPPSAIHSFLCPHRIRVYNRFDELPAPNIMKAIPNRMMVGETLEVSFYGQLYKKGKGTYCGITTLGNVGQVLSPTAMDDMIPPVITPPPQMVEVIAENHVFKLPMQSPVEGFVLFNASNDGEKFGLGKFVFFQSEPKVLTPELDFSSPGNPSSPNQDQFDWGGNGGPTGSGGGSDSSFLGSAYFGNFSQMQSMLNKGVPVDKADANGLTALFWAAWKGNQSIVDLLVKNGADVNHQDAFKETPLHAACRKGHPGIVKTLLQNGANPNIENAAGCHALHLAACSGSKEVIEILAKQIEDLNHGDHDSLTALHYCILTGQERLAQALIKILKGSGYSLNSCDSMGFTPAHWCVALDRESILRSLLDFGAEVNIVDIQNETPLFLAVKNSKENLIRLLLNHGAKTNIRNNKDLLPIHLAENPTIKELLIHKDKKTVNSLTIIRPISIKLPDNLASKKTTETPLGEIDKLRKQNEDLVKKIEELTSKLNDIKAAPVATVTVVSPRPLATLSVEDASFSRQISKKLKSEAADSISQEAPTATPAIVKLSTLNKEEEDDLEEEEDEELVAYDVSIYGKSPMGTIKLPETATLKEARAALLADAKYPKDFSFWFEKMNSMVEDFQEEKLTVRMCGKLVLRLQNPQKADKSPRSSQSDMIVEKEKPIKPEIVISKSSEAEEDDRALDWWLTKYAKDSEVHLDQFIDSLKASHPAPRDFPQLADIGLRDFFQNVSKKNMVTVSNLSVFLKLFGPIERYYEKIYNIYSEKSFHGFLSFEEAQDILKGQYGGYLVRYSQSLLHKGCFVLNVNKGSSGKDVIENYVIRYHPIHEKFIFYNKPYDTLRKFLTDATYANILRTPMECKKFLPAPQLQSMNIGMPISSALVEKEKEKETTPNSSPFLSQPSQIV